MTPVREARKAAKLSIYQVAKRARLHPSSVSRIERGQQQTSPKSAARIAIVLRISEEKVLYPERFKDSKAKKRT